MCGVLLDLVASSRLRLDALNIDQWNLSARRLENNTPLPFLAWFGNFAVSIVNTERSISLMFLPCIGA